MTHNPPRPPNVFRPLAIGITLFAIGLLAALFGVKMEQIAPARGTVVSGERPDQHQVRLEIEERQAGGIAPGQAVRIESVMYPYRTHGKARGIVQRVEPVVTDARSVVVIASVEESPFDLMVGSSVTAEIILGRKRLARIILEH